MNGLANLAEVLERGHNEIHVDRTLGERACVPIERMLAFAAERKRSVKASGDLARDITLFQNVGPA